MLVSVSILRQLVISVSILKLGKKSQSRSWSWDYERKVLITISSMVQESQKNLGLISILRDLWKYQSQSWELGKRLNLDLEVETTTKSIILEIETGEKLILVSRLQAKFLWSLDHDFCQTFFGQKGSGSRNWNKTSVYGSRNC